MVPFFSVAIFPAVVMFLGSEVANVKVTVLLLGTRGRKNCKAEDTVARPTQQRALSSNEPLCISMTCAKDKMRCLIGLGGSNMRPPLVMSLAFMAK